MLKVPAAFRGIERPNERSDTSVQSFDCALGSLAQASLRPRHVEIPLLPQTRSRELSSPQDMVPALVSSPANQCVRLARPAHFGNPDSLRLERAVDNHKQNSYLTLQDT